MKNDPPRFKVFSFKSLYNVPYPIIFQYTSVPVVTKHDMHMKRGKKEITLMERNAAAVQKESLVERREWVGQTSQKGNEK